MTLKKYALQAKFYFDVPDKETAGHAQTHADATRREKKREKKERERETDSISGKPRNKLCEAGSAHTRLSRAKNVLFGAGFQFLVCHFLVQLCVPQWESPWALVFRSVPSSQCPTVGLRT